MARLANLHGVTESLTTAIIPKVPKNIQKTCNKSYKIKCQIKKLEDINQFEQQCSSLALQHTTCRRSIIGIASIAILSQFGTNASIAEEENKLWYTGPLPRHPPPQNKIANEETGTRTFLKKGVYMANIGAKGSAYRLRKYAFDLMAMGDLIGQGQDTLNYVRRYLCLKGTFMYYDFDKVISAAPISDQQPLTSLANRLFDNFEKLQDAVKLKDLPLTQSCYNDTTVILQEVMDRMA